MLSGLFDVAIVGGGPAGLSAALVLGRSRRRVVVCDHGKPRNYAARAVHGYLGLDGLAPAELRERGRRECQSYGVTFVDHEAIAARRNDTAGQSRFELELKNGEALSARKLLLATGVCDELPPIPGIESFYGESVHHCPYCDGWEHRDQHLVACGQGKSVIDLALMLLAWSRKVTCCTNGASLIPRDLERLRKNRIEVRTNAIAGLEGNSNVLETLLFTDGQSFQCDALFFTADQTQQCRLPEMLGCECDDRGCIVSKGKQGTGIRGLFLAGDADGDVQFAIVAAAEGAVAATAINAEIQSEEH
jgi:thioredoxin reductase